MANEHYITITAVNGIQNAAGELANGSLTVTPVDSQGKQICFTLDDDLFNVNYKVVRTIKNGMLMGTLKLANPLYTNPVNIGYNFDFTDSVTFEKSTYFAVVITADGSGNYDLANLPQTSASAYPVVYRTGPVGPSGDVASSVLTFTTEITISAHQAVVVTDGLANIADKDTPAHRGNVVGVATQSVVSGQPINVQYTGSLTYNGWNWTLNMPVFLGSNGLLTQIVPTTGFIQYIGKPISPTTLIINIQPSISLI